MQSLTAFFSKFPDLVKMLDFLEEDLASDVPLWGEGECGREVADVDDEGRKD